MNWRVIKAIVHKDIFNVLRSPHIMLVLILPIATLLLISPILKRDSPGVLKIAVIDPGVSSFVRSLDETPQIDVVEVGNLEELKATVQESAVGGLVLASDDFDSAIEAGEQPDVTLYVNSQREGVATAHFQHLMEQQFYAFADSRLPVNIKVIDIPNSEKDLSSRTSNYLLTLMIVMLQAMVGVSIVSSSLIEEKEKNTIQLILVIPASMAEVALAKALVGLFYGWMVTGILFVLDQGWRGDWLLTLISSILGLLFLVAVGVFLGCFLHTSRQMVWASAIMLILITPSWFRLPSVTLPVAVDFFFHLLPTDYLTKALWFSLAGSDALSQIGVNLFVLFGSVVLVLVAIVWQLRRMEQ